MLRFTGHFTIDVHILSKCDAFIFAIVVPKAYLSGSVFNNWIHLNNTESFFHIGMSYGGKRQNKREK